MNSEKPNFDIVYLPEAIDFLETQSEKVRKKIVSNIDRSRYEWNKELFKKLENTEIWEFRTKYNGIAYRLFSFWDRERKSLVVATHGIIKKKQKTPLKEIHKAEAIMKLYYEQFNENENGEDEDIHARANA